MLMKLAPRSHQLSVETAYKHYENGNSEVQFSLVPGPGTHWFRYRGALMQVGTTNSVARYFAF